MIFKRLNEMAFSRDVAINKIKNYVDVYAEHLFKIIIYGDSTNNLWHWIDEVADKLYNIHTIKLKGGNKFDPKFYEDEFLLAYGDCEEDFKRDLEDFQRENRFKYPKFNITPQLIKNTNRVFNDLSLYFSNILGRDKPERDKKNFRNSLLDYFEELEDEEREWLL